MYACADRIGSPTSLVCLYILVEVSLNLQASSRQSIGAGFFAFGPEIPE